MKCQVNVIRFNFEVRVITKRKRRKTVNLDRAGFTDITGAQLWFGLGNQGAYAFAMTKEIGLFSTLT